MPPRFNFTLLARARTELGMTQEEAATACGVDVRTYRRYESGAVNEGREGFEVRNASRRRLLGRMCSELGLGEGELVVEDAGWRVCHAHVLARAPHFVGREEVLARLDAWAGERGCLAVIAVGGAGKTAVVERWLARLGEGPHAGGVFVWSFYEDARVEGCVARALEYFAPGRVVKAGEQLEALLAAIGDGGPHLLVLDGLEVLQGGERPDATLGRVEDGVLRRLLIAAVRGLGRARVLVTSRHALVDLAAWEGEGLCTLRLGDLSEGEGRRLLERWGVVGELDKLVAGVGGHALSVAMLGSYGAFLGGRAVESVALEPAARDDVRARRLLGVLSAYARALAPAERDALARVAVFPSGVDVATLGRIAGAGERVAGALAGQGEQALAAIVGRLERLGLVARTGGGGVAAHPFVAEYFRSLLGGEAAAVHAVERRHLAARLDRHGSGPLGETLLDSYEGLLVHTLGAGDVDEAVGIYMRAMGGFERLGLQLGAMSRGLRVVRMFARGGDPATVGGTVAGWRARIVYDWSLYAGALGDLEQAIACLKIHVGWAREAGNMSMLTTGLRTLAYDVRLTGGLAEAVEIANAAVEVASRAGSIGDVVRGVALVGRISHDLGDTAGAAACFARAREIGDRPFARRALWEAEHLLEIGEVARARVMVADNLAGLQGLGWEGHCAHANTLLGLAALAGEVPDVEMAREHLERARGWVTTSGEVEVVLRCHELAAHVAACEGRAEVAAEELRRGRTLAEVCGFGLFAGRFVEGGVVGG